MKRLLSFVLVLLSLLSLSVPGFAAVNTTYDLKELGMSIDIPSDYAVLTRDNLDDYPNLSDYGFDKKTLSEMMESSNTYLHAWDKDISFEIYISMTDSPIDDLNLMSDTMLNTFASSFKAEYAKSGATFEKYEIYKHNQTKFVKIYFDQPNGTSKDYALQYYTVYDKKAINITMQSYSGVIDSKKESILESIVNTAHFDKEPLKIASSPETPAFVYHDKETGIEFTVPANWTQGELSKDREYIDVRFNSNKEEGLSIFYGSTDMWSKMSSDERKGISRSDINGSILSLEEIAEAIGIEKSDISNVTYGGKEYYKYINKTSSSIYGANFEVMTTCFARIENGYIYTFQFNGDNKNEYFKDFEALLDSVKYPTVEDSSSPNRFSEFSFINVILSLLITIAIYSGPIMIYRFGIIKQPVEKARAKKIVIIYGIIAFLVMSVLIAALNGKGAAGGAILLWSWVNYKILMSGKKHETTPSVSVASPTVDAMPDHMDKFSNDTDSGEEVIQVQKTNSLSYRRIMYCRRCGSKLIDDSEFCRNCGNKIEKEEDYK